MTEPRLVGFRLGLLGATASSTPETREPETPATTQQPEQAPERTCEMCGASLHALRRHARYCSGACRTAAYEQRKTRGADAQPPEALAAVLASHGLPSTTEPSQAVSGQGKRQETVSGPGSGAYVGGECPDPLRCRHWRRYPDGPWTCEANHPREPQATA